MNPFLLWLLWAMPALVAWARLFLLHWRAGGCEDPACAWNRAIEERPALAVAVLAMGAFLLGPLVFLPVGRQGPRGD